MGEVSNLSILLIDDDASLRESLRENLQECGYLVTAAQDAPSGLQILKQQEFDIVLCDLKMPQVDGIQFLKECSALEKDPAIILMTAFGDHEVAIEAMRQGAYDYISKPFTVDELVLALRKAEERERLKAENQELRTSIARRYNFSNIVAQSSSMKEIFETIRRISQFKTTVLITGESGTGKELIAKAIHYNSQRRNKPFIPINCGAIPENLIESELFGHRRGSFTDATRDKKGLFEEANGGTIFLDEIGELSAHLQVKLLRVLQEQRIRQVGSEEERVIDVRVLAATHRNMEKEVEEGRFRDDLYYRLHVVTVKVPPLRERVDDIPVLVDYFIKKHNKTLGLSTAEVSQEALKVLLEYPWPGNVRELENAIERAMVLSGVDKISLDSLPPRIRSHRVSIEEPVPFSEIDDEDLSIKKHVRNLEISLIMKALERVNGNRTHAAKLLQISHRTLLYKLKEYELKEAGKE